MKDYSELKMLADAAILGSLEGGDNFRIKCRHSVIRGLFDDIERLGSRLCMCRDCGGQGEVYSGHSTHQGYNQPPEPDMDVCGTCGGDGVLGPVEDFEAITTERDQLKAEVERLNEEYDNAWRHDLNDKSNLQVLAAEVDALRKDAERYRWLRDESIDPGAVIDKKVGIFNSEDGGYPIWEYRAGKELDDAIDTAMIEVNNK